MDIQQWIRGIGKATRTADSPISDVQPHAPNRKRRWRSGGSSMLAPVVEHVSDTDVQDIGNPMRSLRERRPTSATSFSLSSSSSSSSLSSKSYLRKSRRRTKEDKYKPKDRNTEERRKADKKHSKRKRRKKQKNHQTTGVVQTFHAKNVSKNHRLTLDPGKAGIYTKGRSSAPVRGEGLPDLVFSEMNFLQKHRSEKLQEDKKERKKREKKNQNPSNEEISAYFDSGLTHRHDRMRSQEKQHERAGPSQCPELHQVESPRRQDAAEILVPTVDVAEKPFLGFGSRGTQPPATSHCTWSESERSNNSPSNPFVHQVESMGVGQLQDTNHFLGVLPECAGPIVPPEDGEHTERTVPVGNGKAPQSYEELPQDTHPKEKGKQPRNMSEPLDRLRTRTSMDAVHTCMIGEENVVKGRARNENEVDTKALPTPTQAKTGQFSANQARKASGQTDQASSSPLRVLLRDCSEAVHTRWTSRDQLFFPQQLECLPQDYAGLQLWMTDEPQISEHQQQYPSNASIETTNELRNSEILVHSWIEEAGEGSRTDNHEPANMLQYDYALLDEELGDDMVIRGAEYELHEEDLYIDEYEDEGLAGFWKPNRLY